MTAPTKEALEGLSSAGLVKYYNAMAALVRSVGVEQADTKRFSDKAAAVKRCLQMQALVEGQEELELPPLPLPEVATTPPAIPYPPHDPMIVPEKLRQDTLARQQAAMDAVRARQPEEESTMAAKKTAARKAAPKKEKTEAAPRGFSEDARIKILVKENPRHGAAAKRFEIYQNGMTVGEYTKKIGSRAEALVHLRWDVKHGHISVK